jgi:hypothetical protein
MGRAGFGSAFLFTVAVYPKTVNQVSYYISPTVTQTGADHIRFPSFWVTFTK